MSTKGFIVDEEEIPAEEAKTPKSKTPKAKGGKAKQPEAKETALTTVSEIGFEGQSADVLPPLALRFTSGSTYRLLEVFRRLPVGKKGMTHYGTLMQRSGIRSPASLSKALKELKTLGIIQAERVHGKATGLSIEYRGLPGETADAAKELFHTAVAKQVDKLQNRLKEIRAGDGDPPAR